MTKKSFLLGLGIGLLFATLTLQIDFWNKGTTASSEQLTVEQVRKKAEEFGYQLKTQKEVELEIEKAIESYKNQGKANPADNTKVNTNTKTNTGSEQKQSTKKTSTSKSVTIQPGWSAMQIAAYLRNEGIVKDDQALVRVLREISKTREVAAGTFNLEPNSDPRSVALSITNYIP